MHNEESPTLLRMSDVAVRLNVTAARAYDLVRTGLLRGVRIGRQVRVDPAELDEFIRRGGRPLEGGWRKESL
jgi:excisionase family DNA binding protein